MNHLDVLRDISADLGPIAPPARMRTTFVRAISEPAQRRLVPARHRGRWLVAAAAAAVIAFAAVVVLPAVHPQTREPGLAGGSDPDGAAAVELDGEQILLAAADRAAAEPFDPPDDDQYVYTRGRIRDNVGPQTQEADSETWIPVDPARQWMNHGRLTTRTGGGSPDEDETTMVFEGCAPKDEEGCELSSGYVADLPTTPEAMLAMLRGEGDRVWPPEAGPVMNAYQVLVNKEIPPDARATIYQALTLLPEHEVVRGVETLTGRTGTAVAITGRKSDLPAEIAEITPNGRATIREELVLDPDTYELLAYRMILASADAAGDTKPGDVLLEDAVADHGIVDDMRVRPDGSRHEAKIDISE